MQDINKVDINGLYQGYWEHQHDEKSGHISHKGYYIDGKRNGTWEIFHFNNKLMFKTHYDMGKLIGLCEEFNKMGVLIKTQYYVR